MSSSWLTTSRPLARSTGTATPEEGRRHLNSVNEVKNRSMAQRNDSRRSAGHRQPAPAATSPASGSASSRRRRWWSSATSRAASASTSAASRRRRSSTPSKNYDKLRHGADIGILADNLRVDMDKMQTWKGEVVSKLTGGVRTLLKANGCDYRTGTARAHRRATPSSCTGRRRRQDHHPGRQHRHRHRLAADRDPGLQVRRQARSSTRPARSPSPRCPSASS